MSDWPAGDGEMARLIRAFDWAATPLGPIDRWSERLKLIVEHTLASPLVSSLVCGAERVLVYNDAAATLYGDRHPAALGRPLPETFPEGWATVAPLYERAFAGEAVQVAGQPLDTRGEGDMADVFDALLTPVRESDGRIAYVHMTGAEVGDRARVEAKLRENEARNRLLIESWVQAVWETDAVGGVIADSPSWRAYTGQTLEEWLGHGWLNAVHPADRTYAERQWREAIAARGIVDAEFRLRAPDGGWRWTNVRAAPLLDANENIEKWVGLNIDISDRMCTQAALRESEERYRALFESMDEAYAVVDVLKDEAGAWVDFRFVEVNAAFITHTSMPWPVGRTATELLGEPNPRWTQLYGQALDTGQPIRVEEAEPTLDRVFDLNIFTLDRDRNRVAVLFTNITERNQAVAALRESEERQAFFLALGDALRPLSDPVAVQETAMRVVGAHLKVSRAFYGDAEDDQNILVIGPSYSQGTFPLEGQVRFSDFELDMAAWYRAGRTYVIEDAQRDARFGDTAKAGFAAIDVAAAIGVPLVKEGRVRAIVSLHQSAPRHWTATEIALLEETAERTWAAVERTRAEAALTSSEIRQRALIEGVPQLVWRAFDGGHWTWASPQWTAYTGQAEADSHGLGWLEPVHPDDRDGAAAVWAGALERGEFHADYRLRHAAEGRYRWFQTRATPVRDERGGIVEWLGTSTDVDDLRALQDRQDVMVAELQHRTRNLIAVVRGVADDTMDETGPTEAFRDAFFDRLTALSRVQGLLSRSEAEPITIGALLRLELDAIGARAFDGRVTLTGPDVYLRPSTVQTLALALHELATNARKYGALSHEAGHLAVSWCERAEGGEPRLALDWVETGLEQAPDQPVLSSIGGGYGRELIEHALPHVTGARTGYALTPSGVRCTIDITVRSGARSEP